MTAATAPTTIRPPARRQRLTDGLRVLFSSRTAVIGLVLVLFWIIVAVGAPLWTS